MVDTKTALEAHRNYRWIADRWPDLKARLHPSITNPPSGMPGHGNARPLPVDVYVSDLMFEIQQEAETLARVLWDELDDPESFKPRTTMPELLYAVADRYGHWTAGDHRTALAFCDWGEDYVGRVKKCLERPAPPAYIGPCPVPECEGELYLKTGHAAVTCRECATVTTVDEQREWLTGQMSVRLMTRGEIVSALTILMAEVPKIRTVDKWIERGRLPHLGDGLYRLETALELAKARRGGVAS